MEKPLVTVVIPVYNAGEYLRPAVKSVCAQTYRNLEIIVVDDGSTDHCIDSILDLGDSRIIVLKQANSGKSAALNRARRLMRGDFWAIQDADDLSHPFRIERQLSALLEENSLGAVFAGNDLVVDGVHIAPRFSPKTPALCEEFIAVLKMPAHDATGLYRASMTDGIMFDETLRVGQGVDYVLRCGEQFPICVIGECLYSHRLNRQSTTHRSGERNVKYINSVIEKACLRRGLQACDHQLKFIENSFWFRHRDVDTILPYCVDSVGQLVAAGRWMTALHTAMICARMHPLDPLYYKPLLRMSLPGFALTVYRCWCSIRGSGSKPSIE